MDTTTTINALAPGWTMLKSFVHDCRRRWRSAQDLAADHAAVRALADSYRRSDPGFAADLDAAAARSETQAERASLLTPHRP